MEPGDDPQEDVFEIPSKEPAPEALLKWRQATLVLNATRRFRYTAKVQGTAPNGMPLSSSSFKRMDHDGAAAGGGGADGDKVMMTPAQRFRKSGHALVALQRFKQAGKERKARFAIKDDFGEDGFGISAEQLLQLNEEASADTLKEIGGALGVCKALRVNPEQGISGEEQDVEKRRLEFGTNTYPRRPPKSFFMFAWEACQDLTLIILMVCALLSLVAGMLTEPPAEGWYEGVSIAAAVILVIFVTALSDYKQSLQFRGLNEEKANIKLKVLRGGRVQTVSIFDLLVGDIAPLSIGDQVPGDGLFVSGHSLTIDESSMTGESDPMLKSADKPFLLSGCKVVDGVGTMVITAVGMNTEWGKVMATLNEDEESETPLQVRLNGLATGIGWLGLTVAALVLVVMLIRYFVTYEPKAPMAVVKDIVYILSIAVTIIVVAVPEGLPLAVTLTLAYSMKKMMADKALVRHLAACETMGSATTICSDKTGTLTLNQMTPMQEWLGGDLHPCGSGKAPGGELWKSVSEGVAQNTTARVYIPPDGTAEVTGSPTESAIVNWALQLGLDFNREQSSSSVLAVETFNSTKKRAGVAIRRPDGSVRVHWKGAAEMIVGQCTSWMSHDGELRPLDDAMTQAVLDAIETMAASSLRCIGIACRVVPASQVPADSESWKFPDIDLTLLAIVGIKDPCRPGVPDAVARCQKAGVKVRMVTGDNVLTARAIASECGILTPDGVVVEGKDFRVLGKEEMIALIPKIDVMARSSPTDKHLLVKTLRQMGDVVAVTGDGTNDAPALKEADIGLSMGITGTEVAKESSDIVILDDNFTSIVKVVRWGRSVFANIQKFIQFQLTVNVVALTLNFIAACSGSEVPLTAVQLLWVNLIMDTLGALALATEAPTDELLEREPVGRKAPLITNIMWRNIFGQAIYQLAVLLTLNYGGEDILHLNGEEDPGLTNRTIIFNAFVFCQLFNEINARKPEKLNVFEGLHTSPLFIGVWVVSLGFQIIIIELLHKFAETVSLTVTQWFICIAIGAVSLPLAVVVKLIPVPATPFADILIPKSWRQRRSRFGQSASLSSSGSVSAPSARRAVALEEGAAGEENVSMKQRMLDGEGGTNDDDGPPPPIRT